VSKKAILAGLAMFVMVASAFAALPANTAKAAAADEGTLYLAMQQDVPDFNTWNLASNSVWKSNVINWGFESLAGLDYNMAPFPLLAESWDFYESNLTVMVHVRQGVNFHDGTPMTAEDVVFTYYGARDGTTYSSGLINAFDADDDGICSQTEIEAGVQLIDDYNIKMVMAKSYGNFFQSTLGVPIFPKHIWEDHYDPATGLFNVLWGDDPDATISTGAYRYAGGEANSYRVMERFDGYWGKDFVTPAGYSVYPPNVLKLYFKIYASLDTAILALQAGDVDFILWAVSAGRVPSLQQDPSIRLSFLEDNGYFYLAFNMKFQPMNDLNFRKAISHMIDKDQIVNVYMGGFGAKGSAALPPFWGEWHNESVEKYPYDDPFDDTTTTSEDLLDAAGLIDRNGDGWRDLPDGTPMEKIIILTPPADYDPVRIRAGQMIAKNMREVGVNAEAKAIDFDTLVARAYSCDYQMLTLGWSLGSDPMNAVFDIYGPKGSSNTYGFWDVDNENPIYGPLQGVSTLADAETQAMAEEVDRLGGLAQESFLIQDQIFYTRWGEGVVADALPCNILYYRVNVEAYRNTWTGYLPYFGSLLGPGNNIYSLANLERTGAVTPGGETATVNAGISLPGKVGVDKSVDGQVVALDNDGYPVEGATVSVTVTPVVGTTETVSVSPATGTTDADGLFEFAVSGETVGYSFVMATVTMGTVSANDSATISSVTEYPQTLYMSVTPDDLVLQAAGTTNVNLMVTDENGDPVEGANCSIDPNLVGYGYVEDEWVLTDAAGEATTVYHAPTTIPEINGHLLLTLSYAVSKEGYAWANEAAATLMVYNGNQPDWTMARVTGITTTALDSASNVTTISLEVVDDSGAALADHTLNVSYSDPAKVFDPALTVTTDVTGVADLTVQFKDLADSTALKVTVVNATVLNSVGATITLTYVGTTPPAEEMYGGYITYTQTAQYMGPLADLNATVYLWDSAGVPADGINASLLIGATPYGSLVWNDNIVYDSLWDYLATTVNTPADDTMSSISGPMTTFFDYDSWALWGPDNLYYFSWAWGDLTGIDITGGSASIDLYGIDVAHSDVLSRIMVVPNGYGFFNETNYNYQVDGQTSVSSEFVIGRSYEIMAPSFEIVDPVLVAKLSNYDTTDVNVVVRDQDGALVEGADVLVYENSMRGNRLYGVAPNSGNPRWSDPVPTDANGEATATITAIQYTGEVLTASSEATVYVKASMAGAISTFAQTQITIFTNQSFLVIDPVLNVTGIGAMGLPVTATVTDWNGDPLEGMTVDLTADIGTVVEGSDVSDEDGLVEFVVDTPLLEDTRIAYMTLQTKTAGPGYEISLASISLALQNKEPEIVATVVATGGAMVTGVNYSLVGSVFDANRLTAVSVSVDGGAAQQITDPAFGEWGDSARNLAMSLGQLAAGQHTVRVNATDMLGISSEVTVTFTVTEPEEEEEAETDWVLVGAAVVGWIVAALLLVMMLMARRKGPGAAPAAEETPAGKPEEPAP